MKHIERRLLYPHARTLVRIVISSFEVATCRSRRERKFPFPCLSRKWLVSDIRSSTSRCTAEYACPTRETQRLGSCRFAAGWTLILPPFYVATLPRGDAKYYSSQVFGHDENDAPRLLVVQPRIHPLPVLRAKLLEALRLATSLEDPRHSVEHRMGKRSFPPYVLVQSPSDKSSKRFKAAAYFGSGTVDIVRVHVDQANLQKHLDAVFVNAQLSGVQQRNLENAWGKPVIDRVGLIIKIFGAHAQTRAAKLQVEMASLDYSRSRLVRARGSGGTRLGFGADGGSQVVSARGRATGAVGGAGETELQLQRRRIAAKQDRLKRLLIEVDRTQSLHRAARQRQGQGSLSTSLGSRLPVVAVVGYTNAGKSSLLAALSRSPLYIDDRLFATLDTRSRRVVLPSGQKLILSDTVGFISDLPIQLVKAFRSTLDEVVEADYLLHVIDSSAPNANEQRQDVLRILEEVGVSSYKLKHRLIEVWNKIDLAVEGSSNVEVGDVVKRVNPTQYLNVGEEPEGEHNVNDSWVMDEDSDLGDSMRVTDGSRYTTGTVCDLLGLQWAHEGVSCVATSAHTRMGLPELCQLLDEKVCTLKICNDPPKIEE